MLAAGLWISACQPLQDQRGARAPSLLNSERIEQRFGSYGIDVLKNSTTARVSNLYSLHGAGKICRTFAAVRYPTVVDPQYAAEHAMIVAGQSIGAVFLRRGWKVVKRHRYFGTVPVTRGLSRLMGGVSTERLAAHVYVLSVEKAGLSLDYASIAEIHHPSYLGFESLREIYGDLVEAHAVADELSLNLLALAAEEAAYAEIE